MPVVVRELRASARHSFTYYLRTLGAAALLVSSLWFGLNHGFSPNLGGKLFGSLHLTLFLAIWILVPLLTADCISRERREGTLGLLFLTRLRAHEVVVAKGFAHGLRAMTLWLAVLPALMIPFLLGGVGWNEALFSIMINLSAMSWALAAGLLASAWSKSWAQAVLRAAALALFALLALATAVGESLWLTITPAVRGWFTPAATDRSLMESLLTGLNLISNTTRAWPSYIRMASPSQLFLATGKVTLISFLALLFSIAAAGARIRRSWREEPASRAQVWFQENFCKPVVCLSFFRRWMRSRLERNPIGWLEQRTWSARLVAWGW